VEGEGRDLVGKSGEHHDRGDDDGARVLGIAEVASHEGADLIEPHVAGQTEEDGEPENHDARRQCAEDQVFQGRLAGPHVPLQEARQHVGSERKHFQGQVEQKQVVRGDEKEDSQGSGKDHGVELADAVPVESLEKDGIKQHHQQAHRGDQLEEQGVPVHEHEAERSVHVALEPELDQEVDDQGGAERRDGARHLLVPAAQDHVGKQGQQDRHGHDHFRPDVVQVVQIIGCH
jgi:hypothetical protein